MSGKDRQVLAAERFYERISFHFDDLWNTLDDRTRTTAVILCLVELGGRALGRRFAYGELENVTAFGPELRNLARGGLAEKVGDGWQFDTDNLRLWRGERWTIGSQAFSWGARLREARAARAAVPVEQLAAPGGKPGLRLISQALR